MKISCVGDVGIDSYVSINKTIVGGTSFNIASQLVKLGVGENNIFLLSAIGTDNNAKAIKAQILERGIDSIISTLNGPSAVQEIEIIENGEKKFVKYSAGVLQDWNADLGQENCIKDSDVVLAPFFKQIESVAMKILQMQRKGILVIDFSNLSDYENSTKVVEENINSMDIAFFGLTKQDTVLINLLQKISAEKNKLFVITLGENGAMAFKGEEKYACSPKDSVKVVDTTGAGDCFLASFMYKYLKNERIDECLEFASSESSQLVSKIGAN